ncbi:TonB-dependent receptor [Rubrivirga sp.]|uniref:TonB-dependent receptor n=1 Tax=Rubrivirga sp. TaxID=1885344 RepID=UPI003B52E477
MRILPLLAVLLAAPAYAQGVASGVVTDAATGEVLIGASVYAPALGAGTATNAYGFFSLPLPADSVRLRVSYVGYVARDTVVDARADVRLDVALVAEGALGEVVVEADDDGVGARPEATPQMGQTALSGRDVQGLPALLGEADVLKAVQLLPGVRGGAEGTAGIYVRGGSPDQTLILLDGVPVYNANHLFGFLSTFNGDAVSRVELTKGAYPARFGGRLGSVLDVRLRDGNLEEVGGQGQVGILSSRLLVEGPVVPGKASFLVSGRRTYIDVVAKPFIDAAQRDSDEQVDPTAYFYDLNAKLNWRPSERDRVYLSLYGGADVFGFEMVEPRETCSDSGCTPTGVEDVSGGGLDWGNLTGSLRYTRELSPRAFAAVTLTASDYRFDVGADVQEDRGGPDETIARVRYTSGIRDVAARLDVDLAASQAHTVRVGAGATVHRFTPGALSLTGEIAREGIAIDTLLGSDRTLGADLVVYAEDEWRVSDRLQLGLGLHGAVYTTGGYTYPSLEPRASAAFQLRDRLALKASAAITQQPLHLLTTGAGVGLPADLWVPADSIGPQRGTQVAVGLAGSSPSGRTTWTLEGYWRDMRGLVAYREGAAFTTPFDDWQELVVTGDGTSRGLELFVQHRTDRLTTWLGYTLAKTDRQFDALNGGERFPFRYDRRHDVSAVALYQLSRAFDVSAAFVYGTGDAVTLPVAAYEGTRFGFASVDDWVDGRSTDETAVYGPRNGFRLPAYVRLDLGATWYFRRGPRPHALSLNVYNATNQKNPFLTTFDSEYDFETRQRRQKLVGVALFPVLPTLSYQFSF